MSKKSRKQKRKQRQEQSKGTPREKVNAATKKQQLAQPSSRGDSTATDQASAPNTPDPAAYQGVRLGISLVYYGLLLLVLAIAMSVASAVGLFFLGPTITLTLIFLTPFIVIAASILGFVGKIKCLSVPKETGSRVLVYIAAGFESLIAMVGVAGFVIYVPEYIESRTALLSLPALILFLLFLRQLATAIYEPELAEQAAKILKIGVALLVGLALTVIGLLVLPPLALGASFASCLLALVGFVYYVRLLGGLRQALSEDRLRHMATRQKRAAKSAANHRKERR